MAPNTSRMWVLGAYLVTTCSVTQQSSAFCTSLRSWSALSAGRSLRRRGDFLRGDVFVDRVPLLGFSAPDVRAESLLSMKAQKARRKGQVRRQRGGPRTDAEGYTAEAFGKQDQPTRAAGGGWLTRVLRCSGVCSTEGRTLVCALCMVRKAKEKMAKYLEVV